MKKRLFLIDGSSYVYRAFFAIPPLSNSKGVPTNAIYGFTTMLHKILNDYDPDSIAVVFDGPGETFRDQLFEEYKANRPPMPDPMEAQIPYIRQVIEGYRIPILEKEGYEADDIIGTLVEGMPSDYEAVIVTSDKDLMQLVSDRVTLLDTMKDKKSGPKEVRAKFGVGPEKVVEVLGLAGDPTDNIPGVPGVGLKTATQLIQQYGSVEAVLKAADRIKRPKLKESLIRYADQARLSRKLSIVDRKVPLKIPWKALKRRSPDKEAMIALFRELEFSRFLKEFSESSSPEGEISLQRLQNLHGLEGLIPQMVEAGTVSVGAVSDGGTKGIVFCWEEGEAVFCLIPEKGDLSILKKLFSNDSIAFWSSDAKQLSHLLYSYGIEPPSIVFDPSIAAYLLNVSRHPLLERMEEEEGDRPVRAARAAQSTLQLGSEFLPKLKEQGMRSLFEEIEMPLASVLAKMEFHGISLDRELLKKIENELHEKIEMLRSEIYALAGEEFNIDSPKQLRAVLFDKLGLPKGKKKKTGPSTDMEVLAKLAAIHPVPKKILDYRSLAKLKGTYVESLQELVDPRTGRVHTNFHQTVTATGRLSSSDPNLQNIPIRTEEGRRIRQAFVSAPGCELLGADYSQVELRILAHLSEDPVLIEAFKKDEDIHTRTACELFHVAPSGLTAEMRRRAKVINFGIIYGMSPYGLANELGIEPMEAQVFIERYFERYPRVQKYLQRVVENARRRGWVETLLRRRRYLPDLHSPDYNLRSFAERGAVNAPIQGSAADLIKLAMVRIDRGMARSGLKAKMLLQVHDELVFEVPKQEKERVEDLVRREMEGVFDLRVPLKVSLGWGKDWDEAHG